MADEHINAVSSTDTMSASDGAATRPTRKDQIDWLIDHFKRDIIYFTGLLADSPLQNSSRNQSFKRNCRSERPCTQQWEVPSVCSLHQHSKVRKGIVVLTMFCYDVLC